MNIISFIMYLLSSLVVNVAFSLFPLSYCVFEAVTANVYFVNGVRFLTCPRVVVNDQGLPIVRGESYNNRTIIDLFI